MEPRHAPALPAGWKGDQSQRAAACAAPSAKIVVIAGPGTGKTEVAAQRLLHLMRSGLTPAHILVLSFSNSAVRTLTKRLETQSATSDTLVEDLRYLSIRTFDSWTFRMLRRMGHTPRELMARRYDDNIAELVALINGEPDKVREQLQNIRHVIVDEFQDLAGVRGALVAELLRLLGHAPNSSVGFTVLGDDAQAIYNFSSRQSEDRRFSAVTTDWLMARLRHDHKDLNEIVLERNYRAVGALASLSRELRSILRAGGAGAEKVAAMSQMVSCLPEHEGPLSHESLTALGGGSLAILTRTNGEALQVAHQLAGNENHAAVQVSLGSVGRHRTVPGWVGALLGRVKGTSVSRSQFERIYAHLCSGEAGSRRAAALSLPSAHVAWTRLLNVVGASSETMSFELQQLRERMTWPDAFPDDEGVRSDVVRVMTIHQSKGMEFDSVGLFVPTQPEDQTDDVASEAASVIFVAVTRAGRALVRFPADVVYPLFHWRGHSGSARWYSSRRGYLHVEIGQPQDVESTSFVDTRLHGSEEAILDLQSFLSEQAAELAGRKVMLKKRSVDGDYRRQVYAIHLQEGRAPGRLLGLTTARLTLDLLGIAKQLPHTLMNLRICQVTTVQGQAGVTPGIASEYASSGLWLGVQIQGVAFATLKRN